MTDAARVLIVDRHKRVDVAILDLQLPDIDGLELLDSGMSREIAAERPETKILFMSGYTDDAIILLRVLEPEMHFLEKPFSPPGLARTVPEVLDAP